MRIERLDWDSKLFGYEVGRISIESDAVNLNNVTFPVDDYKLIYVESKNPFIWNEMGTCYAAITYSKNIERDRPIKLMQSDMITENYSGNVTDNLMHLTYQSGVYSRFKLDKNFKNNEFEKLYRKWIENSLNGKIADIVEVVKVKSKIMAFVTLNFRTNYSKIGLVAVDKNTRSLGLGTLLLNKVTELSANKGCKNILVSTQQDNKIACRFYERNGFKLIETKYIYHWWTNI